MRAIDNFCGRENGYERTITLRNRLIPIGKTEQNIESLLTNDYKRAESYPKVKNTLDRYHKLFIEITLNEVNLSWDDLYNKIYDFKKCNNSDKDKKVGLKEEIKQLQKSKREEISKIFKKSDIYGKLTKSNELIKLVKNSDNPTFTLTDDDKATLDDFDRFTTYFVNYCQIRENLYKSEEKSGEIAYRLVNENFNKFADNIFLYNEIKEKHSEVLEEFLKQDKFKDLDLNEIFKPINFNKCVTQGGIEKYNEIITGISAKIGDTKAQGINECINLYNRNNKDNRIKGSMLVLFKQILSDKDNSKNFYEGIKDSKEVLSKIKTFREKLLKSKGDEGDIYQRIKKLFDSEKDETMLFIQAKNLSKFSISVYGKWDAVKNALFENLKQEKLNSKRAKNKNLSEKDEENINKQIDKSDYSIGFINGLGLNKQIEQQDWYTNRLNEDKDIPSLDYFNSSWLHRKIDLIGEKYLKINFDQDVDLTQDENVSDTIKNYLDAELDLYHYFALVDYNGEESKDTEFYNEYDKIKKIYSEVLELYNSIRNFVTKKSSDIKKIKLNFDCPTLANGWDKGNEFKQYLTYILRKNDNYYLAILNKSDKVNLDNIEQDDNNYEKLNLKQIGEPSKNFPNWLINSGTAREKYSPSQEVLDSYKLYKDNNHNVGKDIQNVIIQHYINSIFKNKAWDIFEFKLKNCDEYNDLSDFYSDVSRQGYKIWFNNISSYEIDNLVEEGKLYLFQIYNKDFAKKADGKKNLHTLYFENLFSNENLKDFILKLNGEAEIFLRESTLKDAIVHKEGSILVNKTDKKGNSIPEDIYQEIYKFKNGLISQISPDAKKLLDNEEIKIKVADHNIIKDRRFTENEYFLHVPITMNKSAIKLPDLELNKKVRECVKNDNSVKIIGLDRGERNLIYLCMINQKGEIEYQESLNIITTDNKFQKKSFDYQQKLSQVENARLLARQNWKKIENIKELKQGYLSAVVHKIAKMMIDNNAIVVLEDLNFGFKHSRTAIERQIYQNFENALLEKLNYLVLKDKDVKDKGGVLNAYQLSLFHKNVKDVGKQSGFVFYIPSSWTSKIDPVTGFANLFDLKDLTNREKKVDFFKKFDNIYYDENETCFVFSFDYKNLPKINIDLSDCRSKWSIYSKGERLINNKNENGKWETLRVANISEGLRRKLDELGILYKNREDLRLQLDYNIDYKLIDCFYQTFKNTLQMRNSYPNTDEDYLISPVKDRNGNFYDSRVEMQKGKDENGNYISKLPVDADSNGAYNIARKGLYLIRNDFNTDKKGDIIQAIKNSDWFEFVQKEYGKLH